MNVLRLNPARERPEHTPPSTHRNPDRPLRTRGCHCGHLDLAATLDGHLGRVPTEAFPRAAVVAAKAG